MEKTTVKKTASQGDKYKTSEIKKIQIAKRWAMSNLNSFDDDNYRAILMEISGKDSSTRLTWQERVAVLKRFKELGWEALPVKGGARHDGNSRKPANDNMSRKIRSLWGELHKLGKVRDPSEKALNQFVKRVSGLEDLHFCKTNHKITVIEALKGMRGYAALEQINLYCKERYNKLIDKETQNNLQVVLRGLDIGEMPKDSAIERIGLVGFHLVRDYKLYERKVYDIATE